MSKREEVDAMLRDLRIVTGPVEEVLVLSKTYCPWCTKLKNQLAALRVPATVVEMDKVPRGDELHAKVKTLTQQRTVPNVFWGAEHVGGYDACQPTLKDMELWNSKL